MVNSPIEKRETDIGKLFDNLKIQTSVLLKGRRVFLHVNITPGNLKKWMDEDLMLSLLMNLVDNAGKASEPGGNIIVSADETGFTVEDFGKGIPKQEINRVTEAFYMVDKSRTGNPGGAGLGLALCQQIVQIHGGKMIIESNLGKGTCEFLKASGYNLVSIHGRFGKSVYSMILFEGKRKTDIGGHNET